MNSLGYVYVHIFPNGKMYFGVTSQLPHQRWGSRGNGYQHQPLIWRAIQKYGWDNVEHIVLFEKLEYDIALQEEKRLIEKYGTSNPAFGYNSTLGGEGILGYVFTEEQLANHKNWLGKHHSVETKQKLSELNKGKKLSDETKQKISKKKKGQPSAFKGKKMSQESRKKLSESHKGKQCHCTPHTLETRLKISKSLSGRQVSQETREKLRQKSLEQWKRKQNKIKKEK